MTEEDNNLYIDRRRISTKLSTIAFIDSDIYSPIQPLIIWHDLILEMFL